MNKVSGCLENDVNRDSSQNLILDSPQRSSIVRRLRAEQTGSEQSRQAQSIAGRIRAEQTGSKQSRQAQSIADRLRAEQTCIIPIAKIISWEAALFF